MRLLTSSLTMKNNKFTRRDFLRSSSSALALAALTPAAFSKEAKKRELKKAVMLATVGFPGSVLEKFKAIKEAGFAGVEPMSHMDAKEVLQARDETGLQIPSVCCGTHWKENLASPNPAERERGLAGLKQSLQDAKKYGATSVLFVPATVNKEISYADAYIRSQAELRKAIPVAEDLGVKIAIENVWNNFLLSPLEMARYLDELQSPFVGAHFDIGNVLRYGWPEQWIDVLGKRILKLHIKEYSREKMQTAGLWKGFEVQYLEGSNDWPKIIKALDEIGYNGWGIAEPAYPNPAADAAGLKNISERLDKIFAS
ncbi:MAG: sugar phosphate isomerase/epimerase family protein [Verrucomicrobiota bacterium]